jgi:hypothetical protein
MRRKAVINLSCAGNTRVQTAEAGAGESTGIPVGRAGQPKRPLVGD